MPIFFYSNAS